MQTTMISVRQAITGAAVLDIRGDMTAASDATLMAAYAEATASGATVIVLNFSGLEYMNSSGIGLLVTLLIRANRAKQRLRACGLSEHYRQILALTRLDDAITIFASEVDALRAV